MSCSVEFVGLPGTRWQIGYEVENLGMKTVGSRHDVTDRGETFAVFKVAQYELRGWIGDASGQKEECSDRDPD